MNFKREFLNILYTDVICLQIRIKYSQIRIQNFQSVLRFVLKSPGEMSGRGGMVLL